MSNLDSLSKINISGLLGDSDTITTASEVDLQIIHEDPNNPRRDFDQKNLKELSESIKKIGVLSPISIKPHPDVEKEYMINHGHRRFRAAKQAGLKQIPAFLDKAIDHVGQLLENVQREDLTPLDIAKWLSETKEKEGLKNNDLAELLSKSSTWVSRHLSIMDAPEIIKDALNHGLITSVESAASLSKAFVDHPDQVEDYIDASENGDITQKAVRDFVKSLSSTTEPDTDFDDGASDATTEPDTDFDDGASDATTEPDTDFDDGASDATTEPDTDFEDYKNISLSEGLSVEIDHVIDILKAVEIDSELSIKIRDFIDENYQTYDQSYDALRTFLNKKI